MKICSVDDCDKQAKTRGMCQAHYNRVRRHGSTDRLIVIPISGERHYKWGGDDIEYTAAHRRVRVARGSAMEHVCVDCENQAQHWAYDHSDPNEKQDEKNGFLYSTDIERYQPMCIKCHQTFDGVDPVALLDRYYGRDRS